MTMLDIDRTVSLAEIGAHLASYELVRWLHLLLDSFNRDLGIF